MTGRSGSFPKWKSSRKRTDSQSCRAWWRHRIGNQTSQVFANVYLNPLDHFAVRELRPALYLRYVDDLVLFGEDRRELGSMAERIREFLQGLGLGPRRSRKSRSSSSNSTSTIFPSFQTARYWLGLSDRKCGCTGRQSGRSQHARRHARAASATLHNPTSLKAPLVRRRQCARTQANAGEPSADTETVKLEQDDKTAID